MAAINIIATTTGVLAPVVIPDLGFLELSHPSTVNLTDMFDAGELADSNDLQSAIDSGWITLVDQNNNQITEVSKIQIQEPSAGPSIGLYAYATTDLNGNLLESRGIASCVRTSQGVYTYLFETPSPTPNYAVGGQAESIPTGDSDFNLFITSKGLNGFQIKMGMGDNGFTADVPTDSNHTVWVLGPTNPNSFSGGVVTDKQTVAQNAIVRYADGTGNIITDSTSTVDATGINIPTGATYKINNQPIGLRSLADVSPTVPSTNQVLTFNGTQWTPTNIKNSWAWGGAFNSGNTKGTRSFEGVAGMTLESVPYFVFTDCILYSVVVGGGSLNNPYEVDIMINGSPTLTYQRLGTSLYSSYYPLSIQINQGSAVWFRFRETVARVNRPVVMCYFREL